MLKARVIPCLLLKEDSLVKTVKFRDPGYIGDPVNAIRIYNEKEVDELIFLDIMATVENRQPPFSILQAIASECFMPVTFGGGIRSLEDIRQILWLGIEKVALNSIIPADPSFLPKAADKFGSQSIIASIDVRKRGKKYEVFTRAGRQGTGTEPVEYAVRAQELGAGEILLTSIDRDGTLEGYDLELVRMITTAVRIPVIACGGAGKLEDFRAVVKAGGASAAAAGSIVVYHGRNRAVLINFPARPQLEELLR